MWKILLHQRIILPIYVEKILKLIDLLEDETQLPEMILERNCIKEDMRELIADLPEMQAAVISMRY